METEGYRPCKTGLDTFSPVEARRNCFRTEAPQLPFYSQQEGQKAGHEVRFSTKAASSDIIVLDSLAIDSYKTKVIAEMLKAVGSEKKALIVLPEVDKKVIKSAGNIPGVTTAQVNTLNVYEMLNADKLIIVKDAVAKIEEVYA